MRITASITVDESELSESFMRASGPGGQNVNKVATAVELRFNVHRSKGLGAEVKARLVVLAGSRLTKDGVLVIRADRFRTQDRNRQDARERLVELIARAAVAPKPRTKTRPTFASKERRLAGKGARGGLKRMRTKPGIEE